MGVTIAIDCMGGDHGPVVTVPAALSFLRSHPDASAVLVGREEAIRPLLGSAAAEFGSRLRLHPATEVVAMDDPPAIAMRTKKDSSMRVAIDLVKEGVASAAVSAGNTGALMAISRFVLKTLPGIDRPAIATVLPSMHGHTYVLDLGANVDCSAEHLLQFGVMGAMLVAAIEHKDRPSVGLLNIGLNFYGNVEGNDIYEGTVDVVVCDGFVGNVALKTSEGLAQMIGAFLKQEFKRTPLTKLLAILALPVLKRFKQRVDHRLYNGAPLLGLRGVVLKSHGSADPVAFQNALSRAAEAASNRLIERISERMASMNEVKA